MDMGRGSHAAGRLDSAARDQKGSLQSGERSNRLPCANHGRNCFRIHVAATIPVDSAGEFCKFGLAFGVHRNLWRHLLFGDAARARDWDSHGAWCGEARHFSHDNWTRVAPGSCWSHDRRCRRVNSHAPAIELLPPAVWRRSRRPRNVRRRIAPVDRRGHFGVLFAGPPRHERRSHRRPALRIEPQTRRNRKSFLTPSIRRKHISSIFVSLVTETPMRTLLQDLRFAFRQFRKSPGFVITAILSLMLGIGATTAIFSVVYGVLLDPYPYKDNNRMVHVQLNDKKSDRGPLLIVNGSEYKDLRKIPSLDDVFLARNNQRNLSGDQIPVSVNVGLYSTNLFEYMGVPPLLGREFTQADAPGGNPAPVAVLSYLFWQRQFGGSRDVVGENIELDRQLYTVIGVVPPRFTWGDSDVYLPAVPTADAHE